MRRLIAALTIGILLGFAVAVSATAARAQSVFSPPSQRTVDRLDERIAALEAQNDSAARGLWAPNSKVGKERAKYARTVFLLDSLKGEHAKREAQLRAALAAQLAGSLAQDSAALDSTANANPIPFEPPKVVPLPVDSSKAKARRDSVVRYLPMALSPRVLAIPTAAAWLASVVAIGALDEWHHEYIGVAMLALPWRGAQWAGLAVMADDAAQHLVQTRHPAYRSPLHRAYGATLYRWGVR